MERDFAWKKLISRSNHWLDVHTATAAVKLDVTVNKCPDRVIAAEANIATRSELGTTLAKDDVTGDDGLAAKFFHTETLADAVASVFDTALSFFMGHEILLGGDGFDFETGKLAAMTDGAVVALTSAEFESDHFVILKLIDDFSAHFGAGDERLADLKISAIGYEKHFGKIDIRTDFRVEFFDVDFVTGLDSILFATCLYHCVCHKKTKLNRVGENGGKRFLCKRKNPP